MWQWVARGNIQQISYIPKTEQHSPFGLMECHYYVCLCVCVCVHVCVYVLCVCVCACVCACACVCVDACMCDPTLSSLVCLVIQCSVLMVSDY